MRDLTDELEAIQQVSENKKEWSTRELIGVVRPGRVIWDRIKQHLIRAIEQAKLQKIPDIDQHFLSVNICIAGKPSVPDCKLSGYGAYLFLNELKPSDLVRSARTYYSRYALPSAPLPLDETPPPFVELPKISLRTQLTSLVRAYAAQYALEFDYAWNQVYQQHRHRYKIDIKLRAKNSKMKTLDWAEQEHKIPELLKIAEYLLKPKPYTTFPPDQEAV
jgi:hypothetical protein